MSGLAGKTLPAPHARPSGERPEISLACLAELAGPISDRLSEQLVRHPAEVPVEMSAENVS